MSIKIDCPECEGRGYYYKTPSDRLYPRNIGGLKTKCPYCKNGKIKVYTEEELQELLKAKQEECALICEKLFNKARYEFSDPEYLAGIRKCYEAISDKE